MESNLLTSQYASIPRGRGTEGIDVESNETAWIDRLGRRESHELSAITWPAQRFRTGARTFGAVRNHQPDSNLALENHSPATGDLQAAARDRSRDGNSGADMKIFIRRAGESGRKCV
jgi:hypothetical protein